MHSHFIPLNSFIFRAIMLLFSVQYRGDFVVILLRLPYATVSTVDSLLTDTSLKRTLRVGPCLYLLPLFDYL